VTPAPQSSRNRRQPITRRQFPPLTAPLPHSPGHGAHLLTDRFR
jgi:hypothetical protein